MSNLNTVSEMVAAAGASRIDILNEMVSGREVLQKLRSGRYSKLVIASHGSDVATEMTDGLLDPELIIQALNESLGVPLVLRWMFNHRGMNVILFNSCESIEQVSVIFRKVPSMKYGIGWAGQITDDAARTFSVTFFTTLGVSEDTQQAFDTGCLAIQKFHPNHRLPILLNGRVLRDKLRTALFVAMVGWAISVMLILVDIFFFHLWP